MRNPNLLTTRYHDGDGQHAVCQTIALGESLSTHLQIAFGRGVFRLLHSPPKAPAAFTGGLIYLRDLPLNLDTLRRNGFPIALWAYREECERTHHQPVI